MQQLFLSPTAVTTYLRCPLQYWWRYVARVRTRPTAQMVTGLAVHRAQERAMRALLDSGRPMPDEEVVQAALDEFDALQPTAYWAADDSTEACRSEVQRLAALYARAVAPTTRPVLVEQKVSARVGPVAVEGVIDLVDADGVVRDLKVRQRAQSDGLRVDYQLGIYVVAAEATGLRVSAVQLDQLVATRQPAYVPVRLAREEVDTRRAVATTQAVADAIASQRFYPTDDPKTCSWCPYRDVCWGHPWWDYLRSPDRAAAVATETMPEKVDTGADLPW